MDRDIILGAFKLLSDPALLSKEELLDVQKAITELEEENKQVREELEESQKYEDPVLRGLNDFSEKVSIIIKPKNLISEKVKKEHEEGIPLDECSIIDVDTTSISDEDRKKISDGAIRALKTIGEKDE